MDDVIFLVGEGELGAAINALTSYLESAVFGGSAARRHRWLDELTLHRAAVSRNEARFRQGTITREEFDAQTTKLGSKLLLLIREIKAKDVVETEDDSTRSTGERKGQEPDGSSDSNKNRLRRRVLSGADNVEMSHIVAADYFISYSSPDKAWAEWISWVLEEAGTTVYLQAWDFVPGSNFVLEMHRVASSAERTIAVFSPDYLKSRFSAPEWASAFAQDPEGFERRLVPVRVRDCALDGMLRTIVYIDLVGLGEVAARKRLLDGLRAERGKPDQVPAFPGAALAGHIAENSKPFPGTASSLPTDISCSPSNGNPHPET
jgi:hypothetical protein